MQTVMTTAAASAGELAAVNGANLLDSGLSGVRTVGYRLQANGSEQTRVNLEAAYTTIGTWLLAGQAANCECRYAATGDQMTGPNLVNTWYSLAGTVEFLLQLTAQSNQASGTIEVRAAGSGNILASAPLTMLVEIQSPG